MKYNNFKKQSERMNRARERKRLEADPPDYPIELPELRRKIIIIDYDVGEQRYELDLYKTNRVDCYKVYANGKLWKFKVGWSNILGALRKSFPRVHSS